MTELAHGPYRRGELVITLVGARGDRGCCG